MKFSSERSWSLLESNQLPQFTVSGLLLVTILLNISADARPQEISRVGVKDRVRVRRLGLGLELGRVKVKG